MRELPGTIIPPHRHPVDEHITVVQGTIYFGVGEKFDRAAMTEIKAGGYAFISKGSTMFGYASVFKFRKGERVIAKRGNGRIRQGYFSGEVLQYEIEGEDGVVVMANEEELRRP